MKLTIPYIYNFILMDNSSKNDFLSSVEQNECFCLFGNRLSSIYLIWCCAEEEKKNRFWVNNLRWIKIDTNESVVDIYYNAIKWVWITLLRQFGLECISSNWDLRLLIADSGIWIHFEIFVQETQMRSLWWLFLRRNIREAPNMLYMISI